MRLTKRQLRRIISELHPRDVADAEYDEELETLGDVYSDMHKEYHGRRPKGPMFKTHEEAISAIDELSAALKSKYEAEDALAAQGIEQQRYEDELQSLMPGEYDVELPKQSGYGRRLESRITLKTTVGGLRKIISEIVSNHVDGYPFSGTLQDLAKFHGNCWGGGAVVDQAGWDKSVKLAKKYSKGSAPSSVNSTSRSVNEAINLNIKKGDVILTGRFKNKRTVVKDIGKDKNGHPTINGKSILRFKVEKFLPKEEWSKATRSKRDK